MPWHNSKKAVPYLSATNGSDYMNNSKFTISTISLKNETTSQDADELLNSNTSNISIIQLRNKLKWNNDLTWKKICKLRNKYIIEFKLLDLNLKNIIGKTKLIEVCKLLINEFEVGFEDLDIFVKFIILGIQSTKRNQRRNINRKNKAMHDNNNNNDITRIIFESSVDAPAVKQPINNHNHNLNILKDIVDKVKPIKEISKLNSINNLPNLSIFIDDNIDIASNANKVSKYEGKDIIPFFLIEKVILNIQKSKTCYNITKDITSDSSKILNYDNDIIIKMGESILQLTAGYILERFMPNLPVVSKRYIWKKLNSVGLLSTLSYQLFSKFTYVKMKKLGVNNDHDDDIDNEIENNMNLLKVILGALVKDFGFDSVLYDISEIIYHITITKYPLQTDSKSLNAKNIAKATRSKTASLSFNDKEINSSVHVTDSSVILSTLSMKPNIANNEIYKTVKIHFNNQEQEFKYSILSNASPTLSEIVENCIKLFKILNAHNLAIFHHDEHIMDDQKLSSLFNKLDSTELILTLKRIV